MFLFPTEKLHVINNTNVLKLENCKANFRVHGEPESLMDEVQNWK